MRNCFQTAAHHAALSTPRMRVETARKYCGQKHPQMLRPFGFAHLPVCGAQPTEDPLAWTVAYPSSDFASSSSGFSLCGLLSSKSSSKAFIPRLSATRLTSLMNRNAEAAS